MTGAARQNICARRYLEALKPGVIRRRAETKGLPAENLQSLQAEVACSLLQKGLEAVHLVSAQAESIIRAEIERALAHALQVYAPPDAILRAAYGTAEYEVPYIPTLITGLAGVGKTRVRLAIQRILAGETFADINVAHNQVPIVGYADCVVDQQWSVIAALRSLATPEVASGRTRIGQGDITKECARWQRMRGTCLLGVDEMQFMAQSDSATTLITRTLLAFADVRIPWFFSANFSLCWKLLSRPPEATQRLLARPVVLLPDLPDSDDWAALLAEYQVVFGEVVAFNFQDRSLDLWNLCAGLKRELVKLLVHGYRVARRVGVRKADWTHILHAYNSIEMSVSRRDVKLLAAHAGQGGTLPKDLACPFQGPELSMRGNAYAEHLRALRQKAVAHATVTASMNAQERRGVELLKQSENGVGDQVAQVIRLAPKRKRTVESLAQAGFAMRQALKRPISD